MKIVKKYLWYLILICLLGIILSGCREATLLQEKGGLQVSQVNSSIGVLDKENTDKQKLAYTIVLFNDSQEDVYLTQVKPQLSQEIQDRIMDEDTVVEAGQMVLAGQSIEVKGELIIDSEGLDKKDIIALEPYIIGFEVCMQKNLELPEKKG